MKNTIKIFAFFVFFVAQSAQAIKPKEPMKLTDDIKTYIVSKLECRKFYNVRIFKVSNSRLAAPNPMTDRKIPTVDWVLASADSHLSLELSSVIAIYYIQEGMPYLVDIISRYHWNQLYKKNPDLKKIF